MKVKWLDRTLIIGPYLCLCLSENELKLVYKHCGQDYPKEKDLQFPADGAACVLLFHNEIGELITCVCLGNPGERSREEIAALLAHETSHVVDEFFLFLGEKSPSSEFKAYCTQAILEKLLTDYKRKRK